MSERDLIWEGITEWQLDLLIEEEADRLLLEEWAEELNNE